AGPTPVSALIHSATMVAAGVFLLLRLFPLYEASPWALTLVLWLGLAGAVVAAIVATGQNDLKRLLAWSTISQLGEMVFAIGLGAPLAGAYHLATHSVFKSTLFLTAGAVDHGAGTRDLSQLGGLRRSMPLTAAVFGLAALALAGVPPLSGFWSEDLIVAAAAAKHPALGLVSVGLVLLAGLYIGRAGVATFLGTRRSPPLQEGAGPKDPGGSMMLALLLGGAGAALTGLLLHPAVEGLLPFAEEAGAGAAWRVAAGIAGLVGLLAAWLLVRSKGTASLFEPLPRLLERALEAVPELGMRTAEASSFPLPRFEAALDGGAQAARGLVLALTGGAQRSEAFLDGVALAGVRAVEGVTELTERTESRVFGRGGDRAAELLSLAGARLRPAQTGRVYLYTLGLFLWTFGTAVVSLLFWR
ncbi:MAG TPA: proton-conducting transporter membrane subunit, partial [Thermoleophilia bacterium]|nr:proton-conducting transporter membrane subunit [Thermoleophilia bacterium]